MGWPLLQGKRPKGFPNLAGLWREPEGLSPDGDLYRPPDRKPHQTGEPRGLSPSGGNSAAKPFSLEYPRAPRARCGVQGVTPCREPEGPSPDGGLYRPPDRKLHQTGEPRDLSPSGGNSAAKPFSLEYPRALWARCGVQGVTPCREPEGLSPDGGLYRPPDRKLHQTGEPRGPLPSGSNSAAKPFSLERSRALWARCGVQGVTPCREALCRAFPKRHTYLYSPARLRRAVRG